MVNKCCVVICDDPFDQAIFIEALKDISPETICLSVQSAEDALYIMEEEKIIPDCIFVELQLKRMDGTEFLKTVKRMEHLKEIPVIVHCTSPPPHKIIELKELGALAIYFRPYEYWGIRNMLSLYFHWEPSIKLN